MQNIYCIEFQPFFLIMARPRAKFINRHVNIPKESRTHLLWDETPQFKGDKDNGKFYRCWNCGQICHDKVHQLGGSKSGDAIEHTDFTTQSAGIIPGNAKSAISVMGHVRKSMASLRLNSSGGTQTVVHSHSTNGGGCPLCHSLNYAGFYP